MRANFECAASEYAQSLKRETVTPTTSRSSPLSVLDRSAVWRPTKPRMAVGEAAIAAARLGMKPMLRSSSVSVSREPSWMVNMPPSLRRARQARQFPPREVTRALESDEWNPAPSAVSSSTGARSAG